MSGTLRSRRYSKSKSIASGREIPDNSRMPESNSTKHLIIAGTNKSGTTAVFRYLGDHPDVVLSKFKEAAFFLTPPEEREGDAREAYLSQFLDRRSGSTLFVEATPQYLPGGQRVTKRIAAVLPDARILFVLRNPADRVISYFRSSYGQPQLPSYGLSFEQFVDEAIAAMQVDAADVDGLPYRQQAFRQELRISSYGDFLPCFVDQFGAGNVLVTYFDQLQDSPRELMRQISTFADIDSSIYDDFVFHVENKTRIHRSAALRSVSGALNASFEPLLNRLPGLRRAARSVYDFINVPRGQDVEIPEASRQKLEDFFAPRNAQLADWMRSTFPDNEFPPWRTQTVTSQR